jgi:predicted nucleic acid-binding protein
LVNGLVDTTILVDILRGHAPAIEWGQPEKRTLLGITPMVWMELIDGSQNKATQAQAIELLTQFEMIYPAQTDIDWAMQQQIQFALSHNVGILDCLIASVTHRLQLPLYTQNLKHFTPLLGSLAQKPY